MTVRRHAEGRWRCRHCAMCFPDPVRLAVHVTAAHPDRNPDDPDEETRDGRL